MKMKICSDPVIGDYTLIKSPRALRISLRVHPVKGVIVTIPRWAPYTIGTAFLKSKRDWVTEMKKRQAMIMEKAVAEGKVPGSDEDLTAMVERLRKEAKAYLPKRLDELSRRYGFTYSKVFIKHNISNWGSCSSRGNINLNLNLMRVPQELQDYVILHELSHRKYPNHGAEFHALLDRLCLDCIGRPSRPLEKELKSWRLI